MYFSLIMLLSFWSFKKACTNVCASTWSSCITQHSSSERSMIVDDYRTESFYLTHNRMRMERKSSSRSPARKSISKTSFYKDSNKSCQYLEFEPRARIRTLRSESPTRLSITIILHGLRTEGFVVFVLDEPALVRDLDGLNRLASTATTKATASWNLFVPCVDFTVTVATCSERINSNNWWTVGWGKWALTKDDGAQTNRCSNHFCKHIQKLLYNVERLEVCNFA